jgi:membrane protease YdiL (CAAX protease family)
MHIITRHQPKNRYIKMFKIQKVFRLLLSSIIVAAILSGCATAPPPLNTSTGKPEAVINGASIDTVFNAIAEEMLLRNYFLKSVIYCQRTV